MKAKFNKSYLKAVFVVLALPVVILIDGLKVKDRTKTKKVLAVIASLFIFSIWWGSLKLIWESGRGTLFETGLWHQSFEIDVSGQSMLPGIKDGSKISLISARGHKFDRGDVISFSNQETESLHYLKRIVGLSGESVVIKNGTVFIDNKPLKEEYVYQKAKTFGNTFLLDCEAKKVPEDSVLVMGDNRTVSWDSRAIGFVKKDDIEGFLNPGQRPEFSDQIDSLVVNQSKLDPRKLLDLINQKRREAKIIDLLPSQTLTQIAGTRAVEVAANLNSWKTSQLPVEKTLDEKSYRYNLAYEFVTFGYLDEQAVVDQIWENPDAKNFILSGRFTEAGMGIAPTTQGECNYPVISLILTWPSVPTYDAQTLNWWKNEATVTPRILNTLQTWVGFPSKNQDKLREAISLTAQLSEISARVSSKMQKREWLNEKDYADMRLYNELLSRNNALLDELFPNVKGVNTQSDQPELL